MTIRLSDPMLLANLVAYLRSRGCIAYLVGEDVEAIAPPAAPSRERADIQLLLDGWIDDHPDVELSAV